MLLSSRHLSRRWFFWQKSAVQETVSADRSVETSQPASSYDEGTVRDLLKSVTNSGKLTNAKVYSPPADVEQVVEETVRNCIGRNADEHWRSVSLLDPRLKYKVLSELSSRLDCEVPNFVLSDIKSVDDAITHFQSPDIAATAATGQMNPIEKLGDLQQKGDLPPNIHVQVEYPGRIIKGTSMEGTMDSGEDDTRSKVYTGVDNVVTSIKYRRKYKGYTAKIKEPLV